MSEPKRADPYDWFKDRQEVFCDSAICPLQPAFENSEAILKLMFEVRARLRELLKMEPSEILDTVHFYIDTAIEDFQALIILCKHGLFSSSTLHLRRMLITWGRINYIRRYPERCRDIRQGLKVTDRDLINELCKAGLLTNREDYELYCESTHTNYLWASKTSICRMLSLLDRQTYLAIESCILEADQWALQSMRTSICLFGDTVGKIEVLDTLVERINPLLLSANERYLDYERRVEQFFKDDD